MSWMDKMRFVYRAWRYRLKVEAAEIRDVLALVKPGQTVVDIGGHKGAFTYWLRNAVGPSGRVLTFEPQPELADYLRRSMAKLGYDNVDIIEAALSNTPGEATLYRESSSASPEASLEIEPDSAGDSVRVTVETLDRVLAQRKIDQVDFIKCDAEGHELLVFQGGSQLLETQRPTLMFECEQRHNRTRSISEIFSYLDQLGYSGQYYHDRVKFPMPSDNNDFPAGVYNFLYRDSLTSRAPIAADAKAA